MEHDEDKETPFSREPWQRLLQDAADAPPATTDARIRRAARRALAPRVSRWLLPASLAASVLLAVVIVERQYGERRTPAVMTEADVAEPRAPAAAGRENANTADLPAAAATRERAELDLPAPPPPAVSLPDFTPEPEAAAPEDRGTLASPPVRGPEREHRESNEVPIEEAYDELSKVAPTAQPLPQGEKESKAEAAPPSSFVVTPRQAAARLPDPDEWYARIEKLRADGRAEEAARELERLEAAYPGWVEENHPTKH